LRTPRVAVIGAGIAGLASAIDLARGGMEVTLFERAPTPGGKLRQVWIDGAAVDAGPTVLTLRGVFDELFADAGDSLDRHLKLTPAALLARHAWDGREHLDIFSDQRRTQDSIGQFAGAREAHNFARFAERARLVFRTLEQTFIRASRPTPLELMRRVGRLADLWSIKPFTNLWRELGQYFEDQRLRQLFARYATYCGSSPFQAPATLMLVAHVEQAGVWYVADGMQRLAVELAALAARQGATLRFATGVAEIVIAAGRVQAIRTDAGERIPVDAIVCNADTNALAAGLFGPAAVRAVRATRRSSRSLSAVTFALRARTTGFELAHHTVFFGPNYHAEFDAIFRRGSLPASPTIYVCAQDRRDAQPPGLPTERLFCLINAPATRDGQDMDEAEVDVCEERVLRLLASQFGLTLLRAPSAVVRTSPTDFARLFPGSGGALYGPASHGWLASFRRRGSRTAITGLYLAGGGTHPGPGMPLAATSGRLAAQSLIADWASTRSWRMAAMHGGTSMR
jgi:1-hydroxycarotenoid 3,4-desaturase